MGATISQASSAQPSHPLCECPQVTIAPQLSAWPALIGPEFSPSSESREFRRELGLPTDRPILMTGHQTTFWHPGILSKYLAADAYAASSGNTVVAWLWVDQDVPTAGSVRYPVRLSSSSTRTLATRVWNAGGSSTDPDVPTGRRPSFNPSPVPPLEPGETFAAPHVLQGLQGIHAALSKHRAAPSAGAQVAAAMSELIHPHVQQPGVSVMSLAISRTTLFRRVVEEMRRDPERCRSSYAAAVAAHPRERVAAMAEGELPLWHIGAPLGSPRKRVHIAELANLPVEELAPRALLMTGLMRLAGCELFIHGTGGGGGGGAVAGGHEGYDKITDDWLLAWLGKGTRLAPIAVVTATIRLRIGYQGPTAAEIRRRQWAAHRAMHDPSLLHDDAASSQKQSFVDRIRDARRSGNAPEALTLYKQMHRFLEETRTRHARELAALDHAAAEVAAKGAANDADIAADRTWTFPLYEPGQLEALKREVR